MTKRRAKGPQSPCKRTLISRSQCGETDRVPHGREQPWTALAGGDRLRGDSSESHEAIDGLGRNLLGCLALKGDLAGIRVLLDSGARCEWESQGEIYSALILAASQGHVDVIEALAGAGAELDFKSGSSGISALHVAALENHLSAVKTLLRLGADVDVRNHLQMTPLHLACGAGRLEIARVLIEAGAELDGKDVDGLTAVHHAVEHPELLKMLVGEGCSLEVHDGAGNSPILFLESEELIRDLFVLAAPRDAQKKTPLMFSCVFGTTGVARMLIESGADIEAKDKEGSTALDWATKLERNDIIVCLFEAAARRGIKNDQGWIPLL